MIQFLLKCNLDDIIQINTDGLISKNMINSLKKSKDMGDWQIKHRLVIVLYKLVILLFGD